MRFKLIFALLSWIILSTQVMGAQMPEGTFKQTSVTNGFKDCPYCSIQITKPTPHILMITTNDQMVGYAYYTQQDDKYRGALQWKSGAGGPYENVVFLIELIYEGQTITMKAHSNPIDFTKTFRKSD